MIVTSAQFQSFLSVEGSTMSLLDIDVVIQVAEDILNAHCGRNFTLHTENEVFEIPDSFMYQLHTRNYPIVTGSVLLSNNTTPYTDDDLNIDYSAGIIKLPSDDYFVQGRDLVQISYQCGWGVGGAPKDFQYLVYKTGIVCKDSSTTGFQSLRVDDFQVTLSKDMIEYGLDGLARGILRRYERVI